jgi:hypothetical protein
MASQIAGWILFGVGLIMYAVIIWGRIRRLMSGESLAKRLGIDTIKDLTDAIAKLVEVFAQLSDDMQFLVLATVLLAAGIYLLTAKPF